MPLSVVALMFSFCSYRFRTRESSAGKGRRWVIARRIGQLERGIVEWRRDGCVRLMGDDMFSNIRQRLFRQFDTEAWTRPGLSPTNIFITTVVIVSVVSVILETENSIRNNFMEIFYTVNLIFLAIFVIEYVIRFWVAGERPEYSGILGRVRFVFSPASLIDHSGKLSRKACYAQDPEGNWLEFVETF